MRYDPGPTKRIAIYATLWEAEDHALSHWGEWEVTYRAACGDYVARRLDSDDVRHETGRDGRTGPDLCPEERDAGR